ncbi:MAG: hypothetical protein QXY79_01655 [Candidatus Methanomethylicia archaeon]
MSEVNNVSSVSSSADYSSSSINQSSNVNQGSNVNETSNVNQTTQTEDSKKPEESNKPEDPKDQDKTSKDKEKEELQKQIDELKKQLEELKKKLEEQKNQKPQGNCNSNKPQQAQQAQQPNQNQNDPNQLILQDIIQVLEAEKNGGQNLQQAVSKLNQDYQMVKSMNIQLKPEIDQMAQQILQKYGGANGGVNPLLGNQLAQGLNPTQAVNPVNNIQQPQTQGINF